MHYVVGYQHDDRGADAIALAVAIARSQGAELDIVQVLREGAPAQSVPEVERTALDLVPADVKARFGVRPAPSFAEGLIEAAQQVKALLIVVGAASSSVFRRATLGSVANGLLHASPVPVALAPRGYRRREPISRLTALIGERPGAQAARDVALNAANRRGVPLRLVSLVALDTKEDSDSGEAIHSAHRHANTVLAEAAAQLPPGRAGVVVAHGRSIEEAIENLDFEDGELVIIGSSRLALGHRLFLGSTAHKVLRALPVPLVVVPREHAGGLESL